MAKDEKLHASYLSRKAQDHLCPASFWLFVNPSNHAIGSIRHVDNVSRGNVDHSGSKVIVMREGKWRLKIEAPGIPLSRIRKKKWSGLGARAW